MGTATIIAIKAMNAVPANNGTEPKAPFKFSYSWAVIAEASLTNALCGLQDNPNKKSKILIAEKNFILSNNREKIIPIVVNIATKEHAKSNPVRIFSTSCLALLFFEILIIP